MKNHGMSNTAAQPQRKPSREAKQTSKSFELVNDLDIRFVRDLGEFLINIEGVRPGMTIGDIIRRIKDDSQGEYTFGSGYSLEDIDQYSEEIYQKLAFDVTQLTPGQLHTVAILGRQIYRQVREEFLETGTMRHLNY